MQDLVGVRLIKQTRQRRRERWQYLGLYTFLTGNVVYISYELIKRFI